MQEISIPYLAFNMVVEMRRRARGDRDRQSDAIPLWRGSSMKPKVVTQERLRWMTAGRPAAVACVAMSFSWMC